jgi:DNA-directed RNA polymerase specialized sigma24 family protein
MDREAEFRRLYDEHRSAVHAYLIGRLCGRQESADLLQEVFMRVWRHLDTVAGLPTDRQRGWIFTVARNLSIDASRHDRHRAGAGGRAGPARGRGQRRGCQRGTRRDRRCRDPAAARTAAGHPGPGRRGRADQHGDRRRTRHPARHGPLPAFARPACPR